MKIFNREPQSWQELQEFVGQMFRECSFETEVSKVVELVRGNKEVDVYTHDTSSEHKPIILVECKYWNTPVHQEVVHAFRTVVTDFGAHVGYIVSKIGFQSGCYDAVQKTNIKLVTLVELEEMYHLKWRGEMIKKYIPYTKPLLPYWLCSSKSEIATDGKPVDFRTHLLLSHAYAPLCDLALSNYFEHGFVMYPFEVPLLDDELKVIGSLRISNDREYFNFCEEIKDVALMRHKIFFKEE